MDTFTASTLLPAHGKIDCAKCFPNTTATWGHSVLSKGGWQLENNPTAWGGSDPVVMVLGFSKGDRQCAVIRAGAPLDSIPFAGMRANLTNILRKLGLLRGERTVDQLIATHDPDFHFGSLIRCSLAKLDPSTGKPVKSGNVIGSASTEPVSREIAFACGERFLKQLPPRLSTVVFLSNADPWIEFCFEVVRRLHPEIRRVNDVAYRSGTVTWVHVVHPSGASGSHIPAWLNGEEDKQGLKGRMAVQAVAEVRVRAVETA